MEKLVSTLSFIETWRMRVKWDTVFFSLISFKTKVVEGRHSIAGTAEKVLHQKVALICAFKLDVLVPTELL